MGQSMLTRDFDSCKKILLQEKLVEESEHQRSREYDADNFDDVEDIVSLSSHDLEYLVDIIQTLEQEKVQLSRKVQAYKNALKYHGLA